MDFGLWFHTGLTHILDPKGVDHILYIIALTIPFHWKQWKTLLWLVTAFTLGHSLTLALSTIGWLKISASWVELSIALTIAISCLINLKNDNKAITDFTSRYALAAIFGCIHGLGFSYLLKSMLGTESSVIWPLLSFNIGLEVGQMAILGAVFTMKWLLVRSMPECEKYLSTTISFVILLLSLYYIIQRFSSIFEQ